MRPTSSKELIEKYSHAKVLVASDKPYITGFNPITGFPEFSREIERSDVIKQLQKLR